MVVLAHLNSVHPSNPSLLNRYNYGLPHTVEQYPRDKQDAISRALMEAWVWLEREGLLAPRPGDTGDWVFVTRRGQTLTHQADFTAYRRANLLPRQLLHPRIGQKTWALFLRGDYDVAVFQAFREVEVRVREVSKLAETEIGVELMRKALKPGGPLADPELPRAEQESMMHLFAGAIGTCKNPTSHRRVRLEATETVELLVLASYLLGIVDKNMATVSCR